MVGTGSGRAWTMGPARKRARMCMQTRSEAYYVTDTFQRRECAKFVPLSLEHIDRCKCGHNAKDHADECHGEWSRDPDTPWDDQADTTTFPTNAYGEINFMLVDNDVLPLYLRCTIETNVLDISELLLNKWKLPFPHLLISVFGGHSKFDGSRIESLNDIKNGFVKAATSTKAWIFTSGVNTGVSNLVGDAIANQRSFISSVPIIGVNSWGAVYNNHQLVHKDGLFPAHYHMTRRPHDGDDCVENPSIALEHEHTHFILLDKGTKYNFHENEIRQYRVKLQRQIAKQTKSHLISILIEGGVGSLLEAKMRIDAGLPVVILGNSGRISDVICLAYKVSTLVDSCDTRGNVTTKVRELLSEEATRAVVDKLAEVLPHKTEDQYTEYLGQIQDIIRNDMLVNIWYCGKDDELDKTILKGLIRSLTIQKTLTRAESSHTQKTKSETLKLKLQEELAKDKLLLTTQLQLAIKWDRLDIANEYIFKNMSLKEQELNDLLWLAISNRRVSFVRNMLDRGAKLKSFLTEQRFEELLSLIPNQTLVHRLMSKHGSQSAFLYEHFAEVVQFISDGVYQCPGKMEPSAKLLASAQGTANSREHTSRTDMLLDTFKGRNTTQARSKYVYIDDENGTDWSGYETDNNIRQRCDFEDPEHLLVVYFTLIHEQDMAKLFWEYSRTPLFLSLICCHMNTWMASKEKSCVEITTDVANKLKEYAIENEQLAYAILESATEKYPRRLVRDLITHTYSKWGKLTVLQMADYTEAKSLIAHNSVQDYIEEEWMGCLDQDISGPRLMLSIFFPLCGSFKKVKGADLGLLQEKEASSPNDRELKKLSRRQSFISRPGIALEVVEETPLPILTRFKYIYKAPVVKFYIYMATYMAFMFGYTCALLLQEKQNGNTNVTENENTIYKEPVCASISKLFLCRFTRAETFIYIWQFALIPLEIRQIYFSYPTTVMGKLRGYFSNLYNKNDVLCMILMFSAFAVRFPKQDNVKKEEWAATMYNFLFAMAFVMHCVRICQAMQINKRLGPKVLMMHKMLLDLMFFVGLVAMFLIAYGVSTTTLIHPLRHEELTLSLLFDVFWRPYTNLFGEFGTDEMMEQMDANYCELREHHSEKVQFYHDQRDQLYTSTKFTCDASTYSCEDANDTVCIYNKYVVKIFLAVYMMLAAVLMLNLLVAVFSSTYENIENDSETLWKWQRFDLMNEFKGRSPLPMPFSTVLHLGRFVKFVFKKCCGALCCRKRFVKYETRIDDEHERVKVSLLEDECRRNYLEKLDEKGADSILQDNMKVVLNSVEEVQNQMKVFECAIQQVLDSTFAHTTTRATSRATSRVSNPRIGLKVDEYDVGLEEPGLTVDMEATHLDMAIMDTGDEVDGEVWEAASNSASSLETAKLADFTNLLKLAKRSKKTEYPGTSLRRAFLKDEHRDWRRPLLKYKPVVFTDGTLPDDRKTGDISWNANSKGDERRSYEGKYLVQNSFPQNPCGRTGLSGRGKLKRWGPNHIALPIITRYAHDGNGSKEVLSGKPLLEVVLECRENDVHSLPEISIGRDDSLPPLIADLFQEGNLVCDDYRKAKIMKRIGKIFNSGVLIYRGYLDSEYNTDNSWLESSIVNYHDTHDNTFQDVDFGPDSRYKWCIIRNDTLINNCYRQFLQKAFYTRNGYDYITFPANSPLTQMYG